MTVHLYLHMCIVLTVVIIVSSIEVVRNFQMPAPTHYNIGADMSNKHAARSSVSISQSYLHAIMNLVMLMIHRQLQ
jgi:hypothetical protein